MANVTFDKKQLPQVVGLGALSACTFGYFGIKMISPPATQAAPPATSTSASGASTTATPDASGSSSSTASGADAGAVDPSALIGAPAPSTAMRDPFAMPSTPSAAKPAPAASGDAAPHALPSLSALKSAEEPQKASAYGSMPALPGAPGTLAPLAPAAPAVVSPAAQWSVSGVICSDINPSLSLAIFRSGTVRRYVRVGEWLDNTTQLVSLDRAGVEVLRSGMRFRLALGAAPNPSAAQPAPQPAGAQPATPGPLPQMPSETGALPPQAQPVRIPIQASPVVTIASADQPGQIQAQAPVVKVGDSVQIANLSGPGATPDTAAAPAPLPTDADSPANGAMDVPTFNSDLPAEVENGGSQFQPASWAAQGSAAPLVSLLLAPDAEQAQDQSHDIAATPAPAVPTLAAMQPPPPQFGGFGMKLVSTPTSVLQALGIDSALFAQPSAPVGTSPGAAPDSLASLLSSDTQPASVSFGLDADVDANDAVASSTAPTSVFQQFDAVSAEAMVEIACADDGGAPAQADATESAAPRLATVQAENPIPDWTAAYQPDVQQFAKFFTS